MDWAQILVIILSIFLTIFLLLGIILTILLIKVTKQIKEVTETASRTARGLEHLVSGASKIASPAVIAKTVFDLVKSMKGREHRRSQMGKRFNMGVLIGAVAGIVAGIVTAPKSGRETRAEIADKAKELKDRTALEADKAREKATKFADNLKSKIDKE